MNMDRKYKEAENRTSEYLELNTGQMCSLVLVLQK